MEGEFVETVCDIPGTHCEIAMLRSPGRGIRLELSSFVTPDHVPGSPTAMATSWACATCLSRSATSRRPSTLWLRTGTGSSVVAGEYEGSVCMAYVRGPEGIIVSLFEQIS